MHRRVKRKRDLKNKATNSVFQHLSDNIGEFGPFFSSQLADLPNSMECPTPSLVDWANIPEALDPGFGVEEARGTRKREQVSGLASAVIPYLKDDITCVEFGAGAGHLGLLLAFLLPKTKFVLVELREFSSLVSKKRAEDLGLSNVEIFTGDIQRFAESRSFDVGISLHSCGLLTDWCQRACISVNATYILCPCCYGRVTNEENATWRSETCQKVVGHEEYVTIAKTSDMTVKASDSDFPEKESFLTAKKGMLCLDFDRNVWAQEVAHYETKIVSLTPLRSSPKNNIIIGVPTRTEIVKVEINPSRTDVNPTYPNANNDLQDSLPDNERRRVKREKNKAQREEEEKQKNEEKKEPEE
eukprot:TRINITY_DN5806_c0_g1_i1.p1 TRINITY_DN5806_c0_g1~~TRINITY_DN5806_c0_g1_i1.p1  ORF type:complete len:357 (-),score=94.63 TRINITY_DN5806_c0_g1_i1:51-1121(-)